MTTVSPEKIQFMQDLLKSLKKEFYDFRLPNPQLEDKIKYGIVDNFLFNKMRPDKNGYHANCKIIIKSFDELKSLISFLKNDVSDNELIQSLKSKSIIVYQKVNNNFHFKLIRSLGINDKSLEKYLMLI